MAPAHGQLLGDLFLAPMGVLAEQVADGGTERLAAQVVQQLVSQGAQVMTQGRVGMDQRHGQVAGG